MSTQPQFRKKRVEEANIEEPEEQFVYTNGTKLGSFLKGLVAWLLISVGVQLALRLVLVPKEFDPVAVRDFLQVFIATILGLSSLGAATFGSKRGWTGVGILAGLFINLMLNSLFSA
jgi:hypothetical protein